MTFSPGDRVLMKKHADWKSDAVGTVVCPRKGTKNTAPGDWYWVKFDQPQRDLTDELHGYNREYSGATVDARFLEKLE